MKEKIDSNYKNKAGLSRLLELSMIKKGQIISSIVLSVLATAASFIPYLAIYYVIREIIASYPNFSQEKINLLLSYGRLAIIGVFIISKIKGAV